MNKTDHPLYMTWEKMIRRCHSPKSSKFAAYGGRGIRVCDRWRNNFWAFVADMGPKPRPGLTIDRRDNDGDYTPENCRWATQAVQTRNTRSNHNLTLDGRTQCITDWAAEFGVNGPMFNMRVVRGMDPIVAAYLPRNFKTPKPIPAPVMGILAVYGSPEREAEHRRAVRERILEDAAQVLRGDVA